MAPLESRPGVGRTPRAGLAGASGAPRHDHAHAYHVAAPSAPPPPSPPAADGPAPASAHPAPSASASFRRPAPGGSSGPRCPARGCPGPGAWPLGPARQSARSISAHHGWRPPGSLRRAPTGAPASRARAPIDSHHPRAVSWSWVPVYTTRFSTWFSGRCGLSGSPGSKPNWSTSMPGSPSSSRRRSTAGVITPRSSATNGTVGPELGRAGLEQRPCRDPSPPVAPSGPFGPLRDRPVGRRSRGSGRSGPDRRDPASVHTRSTHHR